MTGAASTASSTSSPGIATSTRARAGEYEVVPVPKELEAQVKQYSDQLLEAVAATDDGLIERYLGGEEIPRAEFTRR